MSGITSAQMEELYGRLVGDFFLSFEQIAALTDRQIFDVIFVRRNEQGQVEQRIEASPEEMAGLSQKEQDRLALYSTGTALGIKREELDKAWYAKYPEDCPRTSPS